MVVTIFKQREERKCKWNNSEESCTRCRMNKLNFYSVKRNFNEERTNGERFDPYIVIFLTGGVSDMMKWSVVAKVMRSAWFGTTGEWRVTLQLVQRISELRRKRRSACRPETASSIGLTVTCLDDIAGMRRPHGDEGDKAVFLRE